MRVDIVQKLKPIPTACPNSLATTNHPRHEVSAHARDISAKKRTGGRRHQDAVCRLHALRAVPLVLLLRMGKSPSATPRIRNIEPAPVRNDYRSDVPGSL
jgi:hypothetical protein